MENYLELARKCTFAAQEAHKSNGRSTFASETLDEAATCITSLTAEVGRVNDARERYQNEYSASIQRAEIEITEATNRAEKSEASLTAANELLAEAEKVIRDTRSIVSDGALTGFNCHEGDWAERLYGNQANLSRALSALSDQLAAVTKERDQSSREWRSSFDSMHQRAMQAEARAERAEAALAEKDKALEPFAKEADQWEGFDDAEPLVEGWTTGPASQINVGHLRAARRARNGGENDT